MDAKKKNIIKQTILLANKGLSFQEIHNLLGISVKRIRLICKEYGIYEEKPPDEKNMDTCLNCKRPICRGYCEFVKRY